MATISETDLLEQLRWRYATKVFDPDRKIPDDTWATLEESLILTPSSYGLQPWKFVVVKNQEIRESLVAHSWNQRQVADCSHLLVIAVKTTLDETDVQQLIDASVAARGGEAAQLEGYKAMMVGDVVNGPRSKDIVSWAKLQSYIALGNFMTSAALLGIDGCPMEGFVAEKYDEILGLTEMGLTASVLCPVGYRADSDKYAGLAKIRYDRESLFVDID